MRVPSYGSEGALDIIEEGGLFGRSPRRCPAGTAHAALLLQRNKRGPQDKHAAAASGRAEVCYMLLVVTGTITVFFYRYSELSTL